MCFDATELHVVVGQVIQVITRYTFLGESCQTEDRESWAVAMAGGGRSA